MAVFNRFRRSNVDKLQQEEDPDLAEIARQRAAAGREPSGSALSPTGNLADNREAGAAIQQGQQRDQAIETARDQYRVRDQDRDGIPDDIGDIARMRIEQQREMQARKDELAAAKQKALMQGEARAGLAGMGLSGGSAALANDIGRTQDRNATLALGELSKRQRDEEFQFKQRQAAIWALEDEAGTDIDGDGAVGSPEANALEERRQNVIDKVAEKQRDEMQSEFRDARELPDMPLDPLGAKKVGEDSDWIYFQLATGELVKKKKR